MANCCGGKNAGKPISWTRFAGGLGVFVGYHGAMRAFLEVACRVKPDLVKVRDFHKVVFETELREVLRLEDINVNGRLGLAESTEACEINPNLGEVVDIRLGRDAAPPPSVSAPRPEKRRRGRAPHSVMSPV